MFEESIFGAKICVRGGLLAAVCLVVRLEDRSERIVRRTGQQIIGGLREDRGQKREKWMSPKCKNKRNKIVGKLPVRQIISRKVCFFHF